jgi:hypothetical protein
MIEEQGPEDSATLITFSSGHEYASVSIATTTTTGNAVFAECPGLCRVLNIGHSAKRLFAECYTRQRKTLGKEYFAECRALGKGGHSANEATQLTASFFVECLVEDTRQRGVLPSAWSRHSAKYTYFFSFFVQNFFYCHSTFSSTTYVI